MSAGEVVVDRVTRPYAVTSAPTLNEYHDQLFGGVSEDAGADADASAAPAQLCVAMKDMVGHAAKGCETAAAFTTWEVRLEPPDVFDPASGSRRRVDVHVKSLVAVPQWRDVHAASAADAAETRRFERQTLLHEDGHALSGRNAAVSIRAFLDALPPAVSRADAPAFNAAVRRVVHGFYIAAAHAADKVYDAVTDHGRVQGAEALYEVEDGAPPPIRARPYLPRRATSRRRPKA